MPSVEALELLQLHSYFPTQVSSHLTTESVLLTLTSLTQGLTLLIKYSSEMLIQVVTCIFFNSV